MLIVTFHEIDHFFYLFDVKQKSSFFYDYSMYFTNAVICCMFFQHFDATFWSAHLYLHFIFEEE